MSMRKRWRGLIASLTFVGALPVSEAYEDINIAPYSSIRAVPYIGASLGYLVDGIASVGDDNTYMLSVPMTIRSTHTHLLQIHMRFPERAAVTRIRLMQHRAIGGRRSAIGYDIELDTNGDSNYDTRIVRETDGIVDEWVEYRLDVPVTAYSLRLRVNELSPGEGPKYGGGLFSEVEVYSAQGSVREERPSHARVLPVLTVHNKVPLNRALKELPDRGDDEFTRGVFGSMWMFWRAGTAYQKSRNQRTLSELKALNINRYWLYPSVYLDGADRSSLIMRPEKPANRFYVDRKLKSEKKAKIVPFPSAVVAGYSKNILGDLVKDMNAYGIDVIANELLLPYGLGGWDYPRVSRPKTYPCILSSRFAWESSTQLYREFMQAGANGLVLGGDEFFFYGHDGRHEEAAPVCNDRHGGQNNLCQPTCGQLFLDRYGLDRAEIPSAESVSEAAKWKVFEYERLAALIAKHVNMMREVAPDPIITSLYHPDEAKRINYGIAYDVMGYLGGVVEMSSNPYWTHNSYLGRSYFAHEVKRLRGASRSGKSHITLQATPRFTAAGYKNPVMVYGPAFSALMHGVSGVSFYKQDYLLSDNRAGAISSVSKFFDMTMYLEKSGLLEYRTPRNVALLYSRASDDVWYLQNRKRGDRSSNGYLQQDAIMEVLFRNGIPFDLYYLDQPESLSKLNEYQAVLLPYPYAMSKRALLEIERAHASGSAIIAMTHLGEVTEYGEAYDTPILRNYVGERFVDLEINSENYESLSAKIMAALAGLMSSPGALRFDSRGHDVECSVMEKDSKDYLVFCLNWQSQPVEIEFGVELPEGIYKAIAVNLDSVGTVSVNGSADIPASALSRLVMGLASGEARVLHLTNSLQKEATH